VDIRYAIGPIGWANDDIRNWGPPVTARRIMLEMAESGYEGSEMSYLYPQDPEELKAALLNSGGLVLSGAYRWTNLAHPQAHEREVEATKKHVEFCARAGAQHALVAEGYGSLHWDADGQRDSIQPLDDAAWQRLARGLNQVGQYAREWGVTLCVHPHGGTAIEREPEIARFLELTDPDLVGYCIDTGHTAYAGMDPVDIARRYVDRIRYVHLKDVRPDVLSRVHGEKPTFFDAIRWNVFCTPGAGSLDFAKILQPLKDKRYSGWLVVEADQSPAEHEPIKVAREARAYLREVVGK
jgi:inosose dehydratase